jgi:2-keto-3-deoxy-6-phosphogluconate aldolase
VTFLPRTVTARLRPVGGTSPGPVADWLGAEAVDDVGAGDWVDVVELVDGDPPHAVRPAARASPAAYESACRRVRVVTLRSLGNRF